MTIIPFYKTSIESKLTPKELCQKLALFVEQKDLEEVYLRDFLSLGVTDMMIYGDYKKLFMGKYNEEKIEIRTSTAYGSMGGFNLNYLQGKIRESEAEGSIIDIKIHAPKLFNYFSLGIGALILVYQIHLLFNGLSHQVPYILNWLPSMLIFFIYVSLLIEFNMGLYVYKERLFPHIRANSIHELLSRRKINEERRKSRRH